MAKMVPPPATVTAEAAKSERWTDRVRAIGTLAAIEGVDVAPQVGGIVTDYFFESGRDVRKGDRLVKLDTSVEEADLADNKATLIQANLDFERQVNLVKKGAVSQAVLDRRSPGGSACAMSRRDNTYRPGRRWSGCSRSTRSGSTFQCRSPPSASSPPAVISS
jgi:hypothetical protein